MRTVLFGATWSPDRLVRAGPAKHDRYSCAEVGTTEHVSWQCSKYAEIRTEEQIVQRMLDTGLAMADLPQCLKLDGIAPEEWAKQSWSSQMRTEEINDSRQSRREVWTDGAVKKISGKGQRAGWAVYFGQ